MNLVKDCQAIVDDERLTMRVLKSTLIGMIALIAVCLLVNAVGAQSGGADERGFLGVHYQMTDDGKGIVVIKTLDASPAKGRLKPGDQISIFEGRKIKSLRQFQEMTSKHRAGDDVIFDVVRAGQSLTVKVKLVNWPSVIPELPKMNLGDRPFERVNFEAPDGVSIAADLYHKSLAAEAPMIVLCHQAGWSRGEYRQIAPRLNELGYQCLAIDQRSGGKVNAVVNETHRQAVAQKKTTEFVDAEKDIIAAIKWTRKNYPESKLILWGSSYSSSLTLRIAGENPELVNGAMAFSPGEYFGGQGKGGHWIENSAAKIKVPVFITSAKEEAVRWRAIFDAIPAVGKTSYVPKTDGNHGARALWTQFEDHTGYWSAVEQFLGQF